jgi:hypothetical protein
MRRRRINLTRESLSKWFVKIRRDFKRAGIKYYDPDHVNEEYD